MLAKSIGSFVIIVPLLSLWAPILVFLISMALKSVDLFAGQAMLWIDFGSWPLYFSGYTGHNMSSGGDFMRLPSDIAITCSFITHTIYGIIMWALCMLYFKKSDRKLLGFGRSSSSKIAKQEVKKPYEPADY